jgi:hypothetical protein
VIAILPDQNAADFGFMAGAGMLPDRAYNFAVNRERRL